jgi:integrase/recombinase XerD
VSGSSFCNILEITHQQTVRENPDLKELAEKHLTPHSLRVSFATLLFQGGCNIRSINELMDHKSLTTTACYTPLHIDDLRRACQRAHPRA